MQLSYTYILTNKIHTVLYVGVTSNIRKRLAEHIDGKSSFTKKYNVHKLIYYEKYHRITDAIAREKQIKSWSRQRKIDLINRLNPEWNDLAESWLLIS